VTGPRVISHSTSREEMVVPQITHRRPVPDPAQILAGGGKRAPLMRRSRIFRRRSSLSSEAPAIHHARLRRRRLCASRRREASRCRWPERQRSTDRIARVMLMGRGHSLCAVRPQGPLGSPSVTLQAPKGIAGGVKTDYLSVGIRVGNRRVGITADQARTPH
jgi:hypothetical protein